MLLSLIVSRPGAKTGREPRQWGCRVAANRHPDIETRVRLPGPERRELPSMAPPDSPANQEAHWQRTTRLMFIHLGIWVFFGYIIHMFVIPLNKIIIPVLGFPLGFYMAAQGSLIVFVVMLFVFAKQQDKIDRDHGYAEDD
jgi:putative solute:sodium symporter small subunit